MIGWYIVGVGTLQAHDFRAETPVDSMSRLVHASVAEDQPIAADTVSVSGLDLVTETPFGERGELEKLGDLWKFEDFEEFEDRTVGSPSSEGHYALNQSQSARQITSRKVRRPKYQELPADSIRARKRQRGLTSMSNMFVPQGQWVTGVNASFSTHSNDNYTFVVIEGINSEGYSVNVSPFLGYAFRNNMVIGARFVYSRTFQSIDKGSLQLGDEETGIDLKIDTFYAIRHTYQASLAWRQYIPLGDSKRFALFNEMQLSMGSSQAKFAEGSPVRGTYETGQHFSLGITPGLVAFATNNMAIELNVGIMGITYSKVRQIHNQVTVGTRKSSMMNFKVNIFSIGIGVAFYL